MKVRVFHHAGLRGFVDIVIDIEMPFLPAIGIDIKPTPESDYLRVAWVFWDISTPDMIEAHIDDDARTYRLERMLAEGWRKA